MKTSLLQTLTTTRDDSRLPNLGGRPIAILGLVLVMFVLVPLAVWPQLSARLSGTEYQFRVDTVDPIDPFRGAYVQIGYPDLRLATEEVLPSSTGFINDGRKGPIYLKLRRSSDVMVGVEATRDRPASGPYLACQARGYAPINCGIDSWYLPEQKAAAVAQDLAGGDAIAVVKVDGQGHAALVEIRAGS